MRLDLIVVTGVVAFASTNIDDIFLLLALMADRRLRTSQVVIGQYLGIGFITVISVLVAAQAFRLPENSVHFLGALPVAIGSWRLLQFHWEVNSLHPQSDAGGAITVALVTISNGADNIAVNVPIFLKFGLASLPVFLIVFAILTGLWCAAARWLLSHRATSSFVDKWGHRIMPFVLIALGLSIFCALPSR